MPSTLQEYWDRPRCTSCRRPLLSWNERKADVADVLPDAVKLGGDGKCTTCWQRDLREGRVPTQYACTKCGAMHKQRTDLCARCARSRPKELVEVPYPAFDGSQACADADPEIFFPQDSDPATHAKSFCARCPLRRDCLAFALTRNLDGVWGGTTTAERRSLQRRHGIGAVPFPGPGPRQTTRTSTTGDDDDAA